ncbi:MAG: hypothetical protein Q9185_004109 [Variospora sp. 1 TL-2023]
MSCQRTAYLDPPNPLYTLFCPPFSRATPEASLQEATERQWEWHCVDGTSEWLLVVDDDEVGEEEEEIEGKEKKIKGKIIGGACWHVYDRDPREVVLKMEDEKEGEGGGKEGDEAAAAGGMKCYWWPEEGRKREMADHVMGQYMKARGERMVRACLLLEILFVHPSHRRRGAGSLLVEWGVRKADEMGVEAFVEATDDGMPLYAKYGFRKTDDIVLKGELEGMDDDLRKLGRELEWKGHYMWRPVGGRWVEGETRVPWKEME